MEKKLKFAFFGVGNLGLAHAGHMALRGYNVSLCNRSPQKLQAIIANDNYINLNGVISGKGKLSLVTENYAKAIEGRDVIVITTSAPGHKAIVSRLLPVLKPTQHIILHPSYAMGAVEIHQLLVKHNLGNIPVSEIANGLFSCRADGVNANIFAIKENLGFATLPAHRTDECFESFKVLYGNYLEPYDNVMETSLLNLNFMQHPFVAMMNAGAIENGKRFLFYHSGVTPHIANVIEAADAERIAVCNALGVRAFSAKELMELHYPSYVGKSSNFYEACITNTSYQSLYSPDKLYTRFIWEDISYGIMPIISIAQILQVKTPVLEAIYNLCKAAFGKGWTNEARTLENLGLEGINGDELMRYARTGEFDL
ncbi:MAG: NAD/NADP octopine/nopaline dehydrogenase family protein [Pseudomonadota bacterium]